MRSEFYENYMKSPEWEEKKRQRMEIDHRSIEHCRTMQVHHVTYRNLGDEDVMRDLCTVCGSCHKKLHNYYDRERGENI